jgi:hypothetical protein
MKVLMDECSPKALKRDLEITATNASRFSKQGGPGRRTESY